MRSLARVGVGGQGIGATPCKGGGLFCGGVAPLVWVPLLVLAQPT